MNPNKVMIAAPGSGSGKTTITCALLSVLKKRGYDPASFKCGPDYIDPMFHKKVLGIEGRNLDTYFAGEEGVKSVVQKSGKTHAVIEAVMGLYDGISPEKLFGSSYEVAVAVNSPIILVVDAQGVGRTIISLIKGMLCDDTEHLIKGIILNRISEAFYKNLKPVLQKELEEIRSDVTVFGFFPKTSDIAVGSRHLGLMLPAEIDDIREKIERAASVLEENVDIDGIIRIMEQSGSAEGTSKKSLKGPPVIKYEDNNRDKGNEGNSSGPILAVALDEAFCFYYRDNLELFEKLGVRIEFFSPIHDRKLPSDCHGILIGGGYPENHLPELAANKEMIASIKKALDKGIPSLAECGGFMYLHSKAKDRDDKEYDLVGAIDATCHYTGRLVRFGYMEIEKISDTTAGDELTQSLVGMRGHEFHYYDSDCNGDAFVAGKPMKDVKWNCMVVKDNGIWGFPHFYYGSDPEFIRNFVERMKLFNEHY